MIADGKTAIITGASGKLGSQLAISLGKMGFCCLCHYHDNESAARETVGAISDHGGIAKAVSADLSTQEGIDVMMAGLEAMPQAAVLVNSASVFRKTPAKDRGFSQVSEIMHLNAAIPLIISMEFATRVETDIAKIINITDVAGELKWAGYSAYCASKAALIGITKTLAKELAPRILVNAISPGIINWPQDFDKDEAARQIAKVPLGRAARYEEITATLEFIIRNDYLTGQIISVDGGRSLK